MGRGAIMPGYIWYGGAATGPAGAHARNRGAWALQQHRIQQFPTCVRGLGRPRLLHCKRGIALEAWISQWARGCGRATCKREFDSHTRTRTRTRGVVSRWHHLIRLTLSCSGANTSQAGPAGRRGGQHTRAGQFLPILTGGARQEGPHRQRVHHMIHHA